MTNIELFNQDKLYNLNNILFTMDDDDFLGKRDQGFYIKTIIDSDHECLCFVFDNGNQYVFDLEENALYVADPIPAEYFIHKHIEKIISDFSVRYNLIPDEEIKLPIYCVDHEVNAMPLMRLLPYRDIRVVYLSNILIPLRLKHQRLGLSLIRKIYELCHSLNYRLILSDVVDGFYDYLLGIGGEAVDLGNIEITAKTNFK